MMRITVKKIIKALMPYGVLFLYKFFYKKSKLDIIEKYSRKAKSLKTSLKTSPKFIVTLTSYGQRVNGKAPYAIHSLLNQSVQPDKIILWLANGTKIPNKLRELQKLGLEIKFCEDLKSYKKLIPALSEFPSDVLITTDDDIYYPSDWFNILKESYLQNPTKIYCHRAHEICLDENKNIIPYSEWRKNIKTIEYSKRLFPIGIGGILYPPYCFSNEIFDKSKFQVLAPTADDVWFWAMARHNGKEHSLVKNNITKFIGIGIDDDALFLINRTKNDEQINNVITRYKDVYKNIL